MSSEAKRKILDQQSEDQDAPETLILNSEIKYYPCKLCKSLSYDMADAIPDDEGNYIPETCDQCFYGIESMPYGTICH